MRPLALALVSMLVVLGASGCFVVDARQTLRHLDDGRTLVAEGRREICLRVVDDASGDVVEEDCDLAEDPLGMDEYSVFDAPGGHLLVGVAPVDVTEVVVTVDGRERDAEEIDSDLVTRFYLIELPAEATAVTVSGRTETGDQVADPVEVELPG